MDMNVLRMSTQVTLFVSLLGFLFLCFFVDLTESRTLILQKDNPGISPKHLRAAEKLYNSLYAGAYSYAAPLKSYNMGLRRKSRAVKTSRKGKKIRRRRIKKVKSIHGNMKTYAKKYKTWTPSSKNSKLRVGEKGTIRLPPSRYLEPFRYENEIQAAPSKTRKRRKKRPQLNALQRPVPPEQDIQYIDYDFQEPGNEDYFPEETKEYEEEYERPKVYKPKLKPKKKKKIATPSPAEYEYEPSVPKRPAQEFKDPEGVYPPYENDQYTVSYSNFIRHPSSKRPLSPTHATRYQYDEYIEDTETPQRRKKITKRPAVYYESDDEQSYKKNKHYFEKDEYDPYLYSTARSITRDQTKTKQQYPNDIRTSVQYTPEPTNNVAHPQYQQKNIPSYPPQPNNPNKPTRYAVAKPVPAPSYEAANPANYAYNTQQDFAASPSDPYAQNTVQPTKQYAPTVPYNPPLKNAVYPAYIPKPIQPSYSEPTYPPYKEQSYQSTYQQPSYQPAVISYKEKPYQPDYSDNNNNNNNNYYKDPYNNNNNNNYYKDSYNNNNNNNNTPAPQYNTVYSSYDSEQYPVEISRYNPYSEKPIVAEDEFLTRHSSLYNNGLSGVPIQGDGFGSHSARSKTKDYDIGYGELQYDDTRTNK